MNFVTVNETLTTVAAELLGNDLMKQFSEFVHITESAKVDLAAIEITVRSEAVIGIIVKDNAGAKKLVSISVYHSNSDIPKLLSLDSDVNLFKINSAGQLVPANQVDVVMSLTRAAVAAKDVIIAAKDSIIADLNAKLAEASKPKTRTAGTGTGTGQRATALSTKLETLFNLDKSAAIAFSKVAESEGYIKVIGKARDANVVVEKLKDYFPVADAVAEPAVADAVAEPAVADAVAEPAVAEVKQEVVELPKRRNGYSKPVEPVAA